MVGYPYFIISVHVHVQPPNIDTNKVTHKHVPVRNDRIFRICRAVSVRSRPAVGNNLLQLLISRSQHNSNIEPGSECNIKWVAYNRRLKTVILQCRWSQHRWVNLHGVSWKARYRYQDTMSARTSKTKNMVSLFHRHIITSYYMPMVYLHGGCLRRKLFWLILC